MVLSNAERQKRHRARVKTKLGSGGVVEAYSRIKQDLLTEWISDPEHAEHIDILQEMLAETEEPQDILRHFEETIADGLGQEITARTKQRKKGQRCPLRNGPASS